MAVILTGAAAWSRWPRSRCDLNLCQPSRGLAFERFGNRRNVVGRVAAAAAGNIDQPSTCKVTQITGHVLGPQIEPGLRESIRQAGIRIARDRHVRRSEEHT